MLERRADIDWLRVLAVLLVFVTHAAQVFSPLDDWHIASSDTSQILGQFTVFMAPWLMPLFMAVAGMSAWLALRTRGPRTFLGERAFKVFLPLVVGTLIVIPPQIYLRRLSRGEFDGSFLAFYPRFFDGTFPVGNFSYGHLWFLAYLFTYMIVGLPVFLWFRSPGGTRFLGRIAAITEWPGGILWLFAPLAAGQILLRPFYPISTGAVLGDWSTHAWFFPLYLFGFAAMQEPRLEAAIARDWRGALFPAVLAAIGIALFAWPGDAYSRIPTDPSVWHVVFWSGFMLATWCWTVFFLGAARSWLLRSNRFLEYWRRRIYPFYVFHQTVIVIVAYYVVQWPLGLWGRFTLLLILAFGGTVGVLEGLARLGPVGRLFGMQSRPRRGR